MDSSGRIYSAEQRREMERESAGGMPAKVGVESIRRKLKQMVDIPGDMLEQLVKLPRAQRRAWYSDYRRNIKRAKREGKTFPAIPPVPELPFRA
jgi:hypothetical protein